MKKYLVGFVAGIVLATSLSVYADEGLEKIEAYLRPGLPITLDGKKIEMESPPVMVDGSTYLKLRDVAALTGLKVNWNESTQTVELSTRAVEPSTATKEVGTMNQPMTIGRTIEEIDHDIKSRKGDIGVFEKAIQVFGGDGKDVSGYEILLQDAKDKLAELEREKAELKKK